MVGKFVVGPAAAAFPLPLDEPIVVDQNLSPDIISTQFEHLLSLQQRLEDRMQVVGDSQEFKDLELEVAQLVDHLCSHHISELDSPWHVVR